MPAWYRPKAGADSPRWQSKCRFLAGPRRSTEAREQRRLGIAWRSGTEGSTGPVVQAHVHDRRLGVPHDSAPTTRGIRRPDPVLASYSSTPVVAVTAGVDVFHRPREASGSGRTRGLGDARWLLRPWFVLASDGEPVLGMMHENNDAIFRKPIPVSRLQKMQKKHGVRRASEPVAHVDGFGEPSYKSHESSRRLRRAVVQDS